MRNSAGVPQGAITFATMPLGGGGYSPGMMFSSDGTYIHWDDVYAGYIKGPSDTQHRCLITGSGMPSGSIQPNYTLSPWTDAEGCWAAISWSNSSYVYIGFNGYAFKSTDGAHTFTQLSGGPWPMGTNGNDKLQHYRWVVDPQNPNVFAFGPQHQTSPSAQHKIVWSTNGGTTMNELTTPTGTTGYPNLVAVDPTSTVTGGVLQRWAYSVPGVGIFESTTGPGGTYTAVTGTVGTNYPATCCCLFYDAGGNLWAVDSAGVNIYMKPKTGSFSLNLASTAGVTTLAVNPANTSQVVTVQGSGYSYVSNNGGSTWLGPYFPTYINNFSTTIQWFGKNKQVGFNAGSAAFHPTNGKLYCSCGIGVYYCVPPTTSGGNFNWCEDTLGDESMEVDWILCPPGGAPIVGVHDRGFFTLNSLDSTKRLNNQNFISPWNGLEHGWHCDYVPNNPSHIVACNAYSYNAHGQSTDGGNSWAPFSSQWHALTDGPQAVSPILQFTGSISGNNLNVSSVTTGTVGSGVEINCLGTPFTITGGSGSNFTISGAPQNIASSTMFAFPTTYGGCIVAASDTDFYWFPAQTVRAMQSHDGGKTWPMISEFDLMAQGAETGFGFGMWNGQRVACVDKTNGDVYCWNYGPSAYPGLKGIWRRAFGTSTFVQQCTGIGTGGNFGAASYNTRLYAVPGQSGHLLIHGDYNTPLFWSSNQGTSWTALANTANVQAIGYGKAAPGQSYPVIYVVMTYNGTYGLYKTETGLSSPTWALVTVYPNNYAGNLACIAGSLDTYGELFIGTVHGGGLVGNYRCPLTMT